MSFILDALRKSEHERQRSAAPGLSHVPLAAPRHELPRWTLIVIGVLGVAVLALGGAWWQSTRAPASTAARSERPLELPAPRVPAAAPATSPAADTRAERPPAAARPRSQPPAATLADAAPGATTPAPAAREPTLPSATALAAQGIAVPTLRLELHAYSERPSDRFVFINGRKYAEGDRLSEGPVLVSIAPNGVVLSQLGQRFLLSPE